ncbi:MAG: uncharacterized protein V7638_4804 [Acidobacteriota bacterium]
MTLIQLEPNRTRRIRQMLYSITLVFEWDQEKAASNLDKHRVSFEEAATAFSDPLYIDFYDPDHSVHEHRYLIVGQSTAWSFANRLL